MKQQIRYSAFETNSSSTHALVYRSKYKGDGNINKANIPTEIELPKKIVFEVIPYMDIDEYVLDTVEKRLQCLFNCIISSNEYSSLKEMIHFLSIVKKLGIEYELPDEVEGYLEEPIYCEISDEIIWDNDKLLSFICAYDVFYDVLEDDCCSSEGIKKWYNEVHDRAKQEDAVFMQAEDR